MLTLVFRESAAPIPGARWFVDFVIPLSQQATTLAGGGDTPERAFREARRKLREARPRGGLPSFSDDEWRAIEGHLRAEGVLG